MDIDGRVVVVTGAGSGIGRAMGRAFAAHGARIVLCDIDARTVAETGAEIRSDGGEAVWLQKDASADSDISALIDAAEYSFGPVDIYVANAGVSGPAGLAAGSPEWDRALEVNLRAHVRAASQLVPGWLARGNGYFVSIASAAGLLTQVGAAAYAASNHAAIGFAEWLAITYGDGGVGVSCVCPMYVKTPFLDAATSSPDPDWRVAANAIASAGEILSPELVAELTVGGVRDGRFLVLPAQEVRALLQQKVADYERWIIEMRGYRRLLEGREATVTGGGN